MTAFEHSCDSLEMFLLMLRYREEQHLAMIDYNIDSRPYPRRMVSVSRRLDAKPTSFGVGYNVKRYILASFIYGDDLVIFRRDISTRHEVKDMGQEHDPTVMESNHKIEAARLRQEVEDYIEDQDLQFAWVAEIMTTIPKDRSTR